MRIFILCALLTLSTSVIFAESIDEIIGEGVKYLDDSEYDKSLPLFKKALELEPENALVHYYIGRNYQYMWNFDNALEHLDKARKLDPKHADSHCYYGYSLASKGDELKQQGGLNKVKGYKMQMSAKGPMDEALKLDPKNACANTGLARADIFFRKWEEAEKKCLTALESDPDRTTAMIYLGWTYFAMKKDSEADIWLQKAGKLYPEAEVWGNYTIGDIYADYGYWENALSFVEKAIKLEPDYEGGKGIKRLEQIKKHVNK
ncbi:MAG: tetratricopeptide repeat protein [bacterium]